MRTTNALLLLLALAVPAVAFPHPCEEEVARMRGDLEPLRAAIATIEGVKESDIKAQMLASTRARYEAEQAKVAAAEARCARLVEAANAPPAATPAAVPTSTAPDVATPPAPAVPAAPTVAPAPAPGPVPAAAPGPAPAPVPVPAAAAPAAPPPAAPPAVVPAVAPPPAPPAAPATVTVTASPPTTVVVPVVPAAPPAPAAPPVVDPGEVKMSPVTPCLTGCGKDTDCKGDRICVKGECVDPPARKSPSP